MDFIAQEDYVLALVSMENQVVKSIISSRPMFNYDENEPADFIIKVGTLQNK